VPETIAATCRAVASDARLLILRVLSQEGELASKEIGERVGLKPDRASRHLGRLMTAALLRPRRAGAYVYYHLSQGPAQQLGPAVARLVRRACREPRWALRGWRERGVLHLASETADRLPPDAARALDVVFDAATAFGNVRRVLLLRLLLRRGPCDEEAIRGELRMSAWAYARQLDKLCRRGYVGRSSQGLWRLSQTRRTRFHSALLREVTRRLG